MKQRGKKYREHNMEGLLQTNHAAAMKQRGKKYREHNMEGLQQQTMQQQ